MITIEEVKNIKDEFRNSFDPGVFSIISSYDPVEFTKFMSGISYVGFLRLFIIIKRASELGLVSYNRQFIRDIIDNNPTTDSLFNLLDYSFKQNYSTLNNILYLSVLEVEINRYYILQGGDISIFSSVIKKMIHRCGVEYVVDTLKDYDVFLSNFRINIERLKIFIDDVKKELVV